MSMISNNMNIIDVVLIMSEGEINASNILIGMITDYRNSKNIMILDKYNIRGNKIEKLYNDGCNKNFDKFNRTLLVLDMGIYSEDEINANLETDNTIPFLDDSVVIDGVPPYGEAFDSTHPKWSEYVEANKKMVGPKLEEIVRLKKGFR